MSQKNGRNHRKLTYKPPFRIMAQTRKFKEIAETSARNPKKSQYASLETNKCSLFTLRFSLFVRLGFPLPEISTRVYQHIQFAFYSSGDRPSWLLAPSPNPPLPPPKKELFSNKVWEH
jgi:hypothetical protein